MMAFFFSILKCPVAYEMHLFPPSTNNAINLKMVNFWHEILVHQVASYSSGLHYSQYVTKAKVTRLTLLVCSCSADMIVNEK